MNANVRDWLRLHQRLGMPPITRNKVPRSSCQLLKCLQAPGSHRLLHWIWPASICSASCQPSMDFQHQTFCISHPISLGAENFTKLTPGNERQARSTNNNIWKFQFYYPRSHGKPWIPYRLERIQKVSNKTRKPCNDGDTRGFIQLKLHSSHRPLAGCWNSVYGRKNIELQVISCSTLIPKIATWTCGVAFINHMLQRDYWPTGNLYNLNKLHRWMDYLILMQIPSQLRWKKSSKKKQCVSIQESKIHY